MQETHHQRRKRLGKCVRCGQAPAPGKTMCQKHIDRWKEYRKQRIANSRCSYCGEPCPTGKTICNSCAQKRSEEREERKATGLCVSPGCPNDSVAGKTLCTVCSGKRSDKLRELKQVVLDHYGQRCNCACGCLVAKFEHLTIDHKNNDGAKQRKEKKHHCGRAEYARIIREGFPDDLQVLCWNCNCSKQYFGECV